MPLPFQPDLFQQLFSRVRLVLFSPFFGQFAFKGVFQHGLTVDFKLCLRFFQAADAAVELGKEFFYFGDDAVLFGEGE
ncbi:hypothetical protein DENIS_1773 [Desulfonema ishimotonii]|uniref:Uncharacterized protein n=1 Tax=Desulfonema ishimotonii TaxID=45657 RepID=A0A401FV39_9BACT|nr:hypothetical protein DENIS_1773 [Desulfonema ishimotonii]